MVWGFEPLVPVEGKWETPLFHLQTANWGKLRLFCFSSALGVPSPFCEKFVPLKWVLSDMASGMFQMLSSNAYRQVMLCSPQHSWYEEVCFMIVLIRFGMAMSV